jgi:1-deoxyxylulose-5-phosphate synthase
MEHTRLGRTGLQVSRLCLGTMTFGLQRDEPTAVTILDRAADGGIDFLDTSDAYPLGGDLTTHGVTEEILGRWLQGKRDRFIVATKRRSTRRWVPSTTLSIRGRSATSAAQIS